MSQPCALSVHGWGFVCCYSGLTSCCVDACAPIGLCCVLILCRYDDLLPLWDLLFSSGLHVPTSNTLRYGAFVLSVALPALRRRMFLTHVPLQQHWAGLNWPILRRTFFIWCVAACLALFVVPQSMLAAHQESTSVPAVPASISGSCQACVWPWWGCSRSTWFGRLARPRLVSSTTYFIDDDVRARAWNDTSALPGHHASSPLAGCSCTVEILCQHTFNFHTTGVAATALSAAGFVECMEVLQRGIGGQQVSPSCVRRVW